MTLPILIHNLALWKWQPASFSPPTPRQAPHRQPSPSPPAIIWLSPLEMPFLFVPRVHKSISETEEQLTETGRKKKPKTTARRVGSLGAKGRHLPRSPDEPWGWRSWSSDCRSKWCGSCWSPAAYSPGWTSIPSCCARSNSRRNSWDCSNAPSVKHKCGEVERGRDD